MISLCDSNGTGIVAEHISTPDTIRKCISTVELEKTGEQFGKQAYHEESRTSPLKIEIVSLPIKVGSGADWTTESTQYSLEIRNDNHSG